MVKGFVNRLLAAAVCTAMCSSAVLAQESPIKVFQLKNGQTLVVKEVHSNPIVTVDTWIKTGSVNENDANNGVSHFLEHLLFKGTKNHKLGEIENILESKGAVFNAATSKDYTHFYITIASRYLDTAVDLQSDMLLNATLPQPELDRERKVVQEEIRRAKDNTGAILFDNLSETIFKGHPYSMDTIGTPELIGTIPRDDILNYYHKWYVPPNMVTVIVGDVDTEKVKALIDKKFSEAKYQKPFHPVYRRALTPVKSVEKIKYGDYGSGYLLLGYKGVPITDKKDNYALDIAALILGEGRTSRLYQDVKEKQALVSDISAGHLSLKDDSIFYISADFKPENYTALKAAIAKDVDKLKKDGITDEELNRAKTQVQRQFLYNNESVEDVANSIGYNMVLDGDIRSYTDYVQNINKVTAKDVLNSVDKYLSKPSVLVTILPEKKAASLKPVSAVKQALSKEVLSNGLTLITDKNTANDIVSLSVFVKGGQFVEPVAGMNELLVKTMTKGTTTKSALEISKELEDNGIEISPLSSSDFIEIQMKSVKGDFNKAFSVLSDILQNATFPQDAVDKAKSEILEQIAQSRDLPSSQVFEKFSETLYKNHPYGKIGTVIEKQLPSITRDELVNYYKSIMNPQNMVVAETGNIDEDTLKSKFDNVVPFPQSKKVEYSSYIGKYKINTADKLVSTRKDIAGAWLVMGWPAANVANLKDYAGLKIISAMLGNGLSSRLFSTLREKQGLAYEVSSLYPTRIDNSFFVLYIGTAPKNLIVAKDGFLREINRIKTEPVDDRELSEVKQKIIGQFALSQETNQQKAHNLGWFETIGLGYGFNKQYPDLINSITASDIKDIANRYFTDSYLMSVIGPDKSIDDLEKEQKGESKR